MKKQDNILYLECNSGISGDMTVAALLDLGADREALKKALRSLPVSGFRVRISRVKKAGLDVCDFHVILDEEHENHDHDMAYLFGKEHGGEHSHGGERGGHPGMEKGCPHHHEHRNLPEILHIIAHTDMTERAKETAKRIFEILAAAEAKAHGVPEEEVHFHEVGAVDSIVDIISVAVCLDDLDVTECIVPALCEGTGTIRCQHGILSVPVPAVLNIVEAHGLKLSMTDCKGELVTPTGAAIAAAVKTADKLPKQFRVIKTGMGGGKREYDRPGILRAMLIEKSDEVTGVEKADGSRENGNRETDTVNMNDGSVENRKYMSNRGDKDVNAKDVNAKDVNAKDVIYKLETDIDDCSGEVLGYVLDRLFEAGARDAHYLPVYMKKNRPAYQLDVICAEEQIPALERIIFTETTTIGIRRIRMERSVLPRRNAEILTELGNAKVKECRLPDQGGTRYYPEYDSVVHLCKASGKSFREVYRLIVEQCKKSGPAGREKAAARGIRVRKFWAGKKQG